jgi:hypothetical protein
MPLKLNMGRYLPKFPQLHTSKHVVIDQGSTQRNRLRLDFLANNWAQVLRMQPYDAKHDHAVIGLAAEQDLSAIRGSGVLDFQHMYIHWALVMRLQCDRHVVIVIQERAVGLWQRTTCAIVESREIFDAVVEQVHKFVQIRERCLAGIHVEYCGFELANLP